jgi:hypothetical protein
VRRIRQARKHGVRTLLLLGYGNKLYGAGQPVTNEARAGFARYAAWVAQLLQGDVDEFEIWNEWDLGAGTEPRVKYGSPVDYVALVDATAKSVRAVQPHARIVVGGASGTPQGWPWMEQAIAAGLLRHASALAVHLYNFSFSYTRGGSAELINRAALLARAVKKANRGRELPIYVTEIGWPDHQGADGVDRAEAAHEALRFLLEAKLTPWLAAVYFYSYRDRGTDRSEKEDNFGMTTRSHEEKPIGCRLRTSIPLVQPARVLESRNQAGVALVSMRTPGGQRLLAGWLSGPNSCRVKTVRIKGPFQQSRPAPKCGDEWGQEPQATANGDLVIEVSSAPKLILFEQGPTHLSVVTDESSMSAVFGELCVSRNMERLRRL